LVGNDLIKKRLSLILETLIIRDKRVRNDPIEPIRGSLVQNVQPRGPAGPQRLGDAGGRQLDVTWTYCSNALWVKLVKAAGKSLRLNPQLVRYPTKWLDLSQREVLELERTN
jgi:hypothetical protein